MPEGLWPTDLYRPLGKCEGCGKPCSTAYCDSCVQVKPRSADREREIDTRERESAMAREMHRWYWSHG